MRRTIAARAAARMQAETGFSVRIEEGGLGEISVHHAGERLYDGPRLWYPTPGSIVKAVRKRLPGREDRSE